jgi:imidazolonepropionase-like amidohydrolase
MPEAPSWKFQPILQKLVLAEPLSAILAGRVITGVERQVIEEGYVQIEGGLITALGSNGKGPKAEGPAGGPEIIRTTGTILPGIINSHAHLAWDGIHDLAAQALHDRPEISAYKSASNMLVSLRSGITTVRDLGMKQASFFAKQAVEQGLFPGPRIITCGEAIVQTGGHTYWCCREASGPDEMRRAVREQVRQGADLIKVMACHDTLEFTDEELHAVVDESHRNNLPITAHATFNSAISRVAEFGIDCIEHGGSMTEQTIDLLLSKNVPIVTTFSPLVMQSRPEIARKYNIPEWKIQERQAAIADKTRFDSLVRAASAGVRVVFGTDAGSPVVRHDVVVPELEFMVSLGIVKDNYAALMSATREAAVVNGIEGKVGTLEVGKEADIIVVDGNPIDDLGALSKVKMTLVQGKRLV